LSAALTTVGAFFMTAPPAAAHHAFGGEFDANRPVLLKGKIVKVEWVNPHSWIHVEVTNAAGQKEIWMIEGGSPNSLLRRGVTLDIDLRTELEIEQSRDPLADDPRFHYEHISLLGTGLLEWLRHARLDEAYTEVLAHHQGQLREVFHSLAAHQDGAVLFHCAAGKDRTGIVAAILLSLAGVDHEAIVHDYAISSHYLRESTTEQDGATSSPPGTMARFLDTLDRQYGGARAYLVKIGLSETEVDALSHRLGQ